MRTFCFSGVSLNPKTRSNSAASGLDAEKRKKKVKEKGGKSLPNCLLSCVQSAATSCCPTLSLTIQEAGGGLRVEGGELSAVLKPGIEEEEEEEEESYCSTQGPLSVTTSRPRKGKKGGGGGGRLAAARSHVCITKRAWIRLLHGAVI